MTGMSRKIQILASKVSSAKSGHCHVLVLYLLIMIQSPYLLISLSCMVAAELDHFCQPHTAINLFQMSDFHYFILDCDTLSSNVVSDFTLYFVNSHLKSDHINENYVM